MTERLPDTEQDKELKDLRDIVQRDNQKIKALKSLAWSLSEILDKNDVESDEVAAIRAELSGM